jgi:hypothetical protein
MGTSPSVCKTFMGRWILYKIWIHWPQAASSVNISRLYKASEAETICRHIILLTSLISSQQGFIKTANVLNHGTKLSRTSLKFKLCRSDKSYVWLDYFSYTNTTTINLSSLFLSLACYYSYKTCSCLAGQLSNLSI